MAEQLYNVSIANNGEKTLTPAGYASAKPQEQPCFPGHVPRPSEERLADPTEMLQTFQQHPDATASYPKGMIHYSQDPEQ